MLPSFGLAVAMHALLVVAMTIAVQWRTQPAAPVIAEIWNTLPPTQPQPSPPQPEPVPTPQPQPSPQPSPPPEPEREADLELQTRKAPPKKIETPTPAPTPPAKPPEPKKPEAKQPLREPAKAPPKAEPPRPRTDMERLLQQAGATPAPNAAAAGAATPGTTTSGVRGSDSGYSALVIACIRPHVVYVVPPGTAAGIYAEFRVELLPDASVAGLRLVRASGLAGYDAAAERAIRRCDPFPRKRDGSLDRTIDIRMFPVESR